MRRASIGGTAMGVGTVLAAANTLWITLVGVELATSLLKFAVELQFVRMDFQLAPYSAFTALLLLAISFGAGALLGAVFAILWNWLPRASEPEGKRDTERSPATTN